MTAEGHKVASLHGAKDAAERDAIIDSFREGREKVLITTNVIARGIDVLQVNMVVNYDLPLDGDNRPDPETYLHRIGASLPLWRGHLSTHEQSNRSYWSLWTSRSVDQLRA